MFKGNTYIQTHGAFTNNGKIQDNSGKRMSRKMELYYCKPLMVHEVLHYWSMKLQY